MTVEITAKEVIEAIEKGKDFTLVDYLDYGFSFHNTLSSSDRARKWIIKHNMNSQHNLKEEDYVVVCSITTTYGKVYKLKGFHHKDLERLAKFIYYPNDDGEYDGGPFVVNRAELFDYFSSLA